MNTFEVSKNNRLKILFLIHDLGQGGAEKVLVNLVNHLDRDRFDISVISLFGGGINEKRLREDINYHSVFPNTIPANSHLMKLFTPKQLHKMIIKENYDIEISYLEGPSARVISGCTEEETKLISWIHVEQHTMKKLARSFRNKNEAIACYNRFNQTVAVSEFVKADFTDVLNYKKPVIVLYNTVESDVIMQQAKEPVQDIIDDGSFKLIAVGTLKRSKGYMRLLSIVNHLKNYKRFVLYILGEGPLKEEMQKYILDHQLESYVKLLGYQINPYKYITRSDLMICASYAEGFSTAVTESLIVGTPVVTVEVSGMKELLGNNEYGIITENNEESLYKGIKSLLDNEELLDYYAKQAMLRGKHFDTNETVRAVEKMLIELKAS